MRQVFPGALGELLTWLFAKNPFFSPSRPQLSFKDIATIIRIFYPTYKMSPDVGKHILQSIEKAKDKEYEHVYSSYVERKIDIIRMDTKHYAENAEVIYLERAAQVMDPDSSIASYEQLFDKELNALRIGFNKSSRGSIYHMVNFLINHPHCNESEYYRQLFFPIYALFKQEGKALIQVDLNDVSKPAHERDMVSMQNILLSLMIMLGKLNLFAVDLDYNARMTTTRCCVLHIISAAITLAEDDIHQAQLLKVHDYTSNPAYFSQAFSILSLNRSIENNIACFSGSKAVEPKTMDELLAQVSNGTQKTMYIARTATGGIDISKLDRHAGSSSQTTLYTSLYCDEVLEEDDYSEEPKQNNKIAGLIS
jgi:hypothetical protein